MAELGQSASPTQRQPYDAAKYESLYSFKGAPDGAYPQTALIAVNGRLYGTTLGGGKFGGGTVFEVSPSGKERVLHSFGGGRDGLIPFSSLTAWNGMLYGDTAAGGGTGCHFGPYGFGCGTIFEISTSGRERVLYRFKGGEDGSTPQVRLIVLNGKLYGTTLSGGGSGCLYGTGCGTVFEISSSGKERVLYRFKGGTDGGFPTSSLLAMNGAFYGTTFYGGANDDGTVYRVSTSGHERVLYRFKGGADGMHPWANLVALGSMLYGSTNQGGGTGCFQATGCGIIFDMTPSGEEHVLYRFRSGRLGGNLYAALTNVDGLFYGAAMSGGRAGCTVLATPSSCGTLFAIDPLGGRPRVLHDFGGSAVDGTNPQGTLTEMNGAFYGTTWLGGAHNKGTIYKLVP